jgi:hypothetical protein
MRTYPHKKPRHETGAEVIGRLKWGPKLVRLVPLNAILVVALPAPAAMESVRVMNRFEACVAADAAWGCWRR